MHKRRENRMYYVVIHGRKPGIYRSNQQALAQVHGFPYGEMKKIKGLKAAKSYFEQYRQTNTKNKVYYVVKPGRNPGLYLNKQKALQQIKGYPYGKVKRIKGYDNAHTYFHGEDANEQEKVPSIFIDGSYLQDTSFSGYGFVVVENNDIIAKDGGTIVDFDIIHLHSLGTELYAFIRAIEWALINSYKYVRIIYDSASVVQLIEQDTVKKDPSARGNKKLINLYLQYKPYITIEYAHKSERDDYEKYHRLAHDISRVMSNMMNN